MTRLVIDASIWLPAFVGPDDAPPVRLFEALMDSAFEAVACPLLLDEVRRGLAKPYFRDRLSAENADRLMRALTRASVQLRDPRSPPAVLRDPTDDYLVALATTARARARDRRQGPARPPGPPSAGADGSGGLRTARPPLNLLRKSDRPERRRRPPGCRFVAARELR